MLFLGMISNAVVSSTNLMRNFQKRGRLLVMIVNRITPYLVPRGIPPLGDFQSDIVPSILTACVLLVRNALVQLINTGCTLRYRSSLIRISWSIISKLLEKSAKKSLAPQFPVSSNGYYYIGVMVITYTDYAPIRGKLSYGQIRNCNRKASAILNLEAWFASENLRRFHQGKSLRSHGFSLLYSKRYQPSLHS